MQMSSIYLQTPIIYLCVVFFSICIVTIMNGSGVLLHVRHLGWADSYQIQLKPLNLR